VRRGAGCTGVNADLLVIAVASRMPFTRSVRVTVWNSTSALYRGTFSRQRSDGSEINQVTASYLVTDGAAGRRISVLAVHSS
jgi:hypothetical protein